MKNIKLQSKLIVLGLIIGLTLTGCSDGVRNTKSVITSKLRIAVQYGIGYAPIYVMERKGLLEKYLPGMVVEKIVLGNAAAISEALASNRLDIGAIGIPQVLIAWDKGIEIGILAGFPITGLSELHSRDYIKSLADFTPTDKIAVPGLTNSHGLLFLMACEKELGNAHALDNNVVSMPHPDAVMALMSGSISAHFTSSVYGKQEEKSGFATILNTHDIVGGDVTGAVLVATKKLHDTNPIAMAGILAAFSEAIILIQQHDPAVFSIIAETEKMTEKEVLENLEDYLNFTTTIYGLEFYNDFMLKEGMISKKPALEDILWEPALATIGKRSGEPGILEEAQKRK
ncbi:ABC transporter substrate-binding protein [Treponema primitia]|uniref:ABC transporter substrate-binding protein n=1 Tax=Treponema primitia TaxID=88058 RepID=UPI0002554EE8|nr:ABC transporter substrate-binding protein [Treponema primitia]